MFSEDLLNDLKKMSLEEVSEKYNLTFKELFTLSKKYHNKNKVKTNKNSYVHKTNSGNWTIRKFVKGKMIYYGTYGLKKDAQTIVQELMEVDWDINELDNILYKLNIQSKIVKTSKEA